MSRIAPHKAPTTGRSAILKLIPARTVQEMKFPGARYGLKMACGENPKRVYGRRGGPSTRMGNMAGYRAAFIQAEGYRRKWDAWNKDHKGDPPEEPAARIAGRGAARQHLRAEPLLPRR